MLRFSVVYRSTQGKNYAETKISKFMEEFDDYLDGLVGKAGSPIICGDFNFHVEDKRDSIAKQFIALCESKGFIQHVDSPTHVSGGTLDLMFTLGNIMDSVPISDMRVETNTGTLSDHFLVRLQTTLLTLQDDHSANFAEKIFREMKKIDVTEFKHDIFCSELNLSEYRTLDETVDLYNEVLEQILDKHAPLISRKFRTGRSEFWDEKCQNARRERRRAKRISKKHPEDKELRNLHHEKCIDADITINQARNKGGCSPQKIPKNPKKSQKNPIPIYRFWCSDWDFLGFFGFFWDFLGFFGIFWVFLGFFGIFWFFLVF